MRRLKLSFMKLSLSLKRLETQVTELPEVFFQVRITRHSGSVCSCTFHSKESALVSALGGCNLTGAPDSPATRSAESGDAGEETPGWRQRDGHQAERRRPSAVASPKPGGRGTSPPAPSAEARKGPRTPESSYSLLSTSSGTGMP